MAREGPEYGRKRSRNAANPSEQRDNSLTRNTPPAVVDASQRHAKGTLFRGKQKQRGNRHKIQWWFKVTEVTHSNPHD